jgi:hypothetical protein
MTFPVVCVEKVLCDVVYWLEEVRQDVCNVQSEVERQRLTLERVCTELERMRAEVAQMKRKERFRELAAQETKLVFSDAGMERRRLAHFEKLAPVVDEGAVQAC